ncbi:MAG: hypothetical protein Kow0089_15640 [Desulfobulbaceae bacterium]
MILSWTPVTVVDIAGSLLTLLVACGCAVIAGRRKSERPDDTFSDYILLLTLTFVFFAVSRSFGHLVKQLLFFSRHDALWLQIAPYSGAINTATFIVIAAFGFSFQRFQTIHLALTAYKDNLEEMVADRTRELELENRQREKAEHQLRESNATLENIFQSAPPMCITTTDFDLVEANEAYQRLWPVSGEGGAGRLKCYDSRPGSLCHTPECPLTQILSGRDEVICETVRTGRGNIRDRTYLQSTRPFRDAEGNMAGTVTSFQDITERKRARLELEAERERLTVTLRSIGDGVIATDMEGRIVLMNRVAEQLCGWSQHEADNRPIDEVFRIVDEKSGAPRENPVHKVLAGGTVVSLANHTVLVSRDGTRRSIADSGAPIRDRTSAIIGVVLVFRDVTEKQLLEQELMKTQKLESIGVLAGGIAHDFNNILSVILGNIDLALHRLEGDERVRSLLKDAEKASLHAKGLTGQLLTFARGGAPVRRNVSIEGVVRDSARFVLHGSGIGCEMDFAEDLHRVEIDPDQISQVVQNIVLNSREAMGDGGMIRITCENSDEPAAEAAGGTSLRLTISDTGPGIEPAVLDKVFDPFFSTKDKGSGLGLAICHSIVSRHGGSIRVDSPLESGAVFTVLLPVGEPGVQEEMTDESPVLPEAKGGRILVMDDEEMVASVSRRMLEQMGYEVALSRDGEEAIKLYGAALEGGERFDLVIMDLTVPGGMGGREAVKHILQIDPEARILVASGYSNDPVMAEWERHGFRGAVVKPFVLGELAEAVRKGLDDA